MLPTLGQVASNSLWLEGYHAGQGGCGHDPQPDSRTDGGHARGWWLLFQVWHGDEFQNCILDFIWNEYLKYNPFYAILRKKLRKKNRKCADSIYVYVDVEYL